MKLDVYGNKIYRNLHPCMWMLLGALIVMLAQNIHTVSQMDWYTATSPESEYKQGDKFACWWLDDVMSTPSYQDNSQFQKDVFEVFKKHCVDMPRPESMKKGVLP